MMFFFSFFAYLPKIILGFCIAHMLWSDTKYSSLFLKFSVAPLIGMGLTTIFLFFWKLLGLGNLEYFWFEIVFVLIVTVFTMKMRWIALKSIRINDMPSLTSSVDRVLLLFLLITFAASVAGFILTMLIRPHGSEDAWSNWNLVGRYIYGSKDMSNALDYIASNTFPGYPFMVGLNVANGWIFVNDVTTRIPILASALFTYSIPAILFFTLIKIRNFRVAATATTLMCGAWLAQAGTALYADIPVGSYFLAAGAMLALYMHTESPGLITLAGFLVGIAGWTKNDGIPFILLTFFVVLVISFHQQNKKLVLSFLLGLVIPAIAIGTYKLFLAAPGNIVTTSNGPLERLFDISRFEVVLRHFTVTTSGYGSPPIGYIWILFAILIVVGGGFHKQIVQYLSFLLFSQYAIYFFVYMITPLDLQWHLNTSMGRVLTHLMPLLTLNVFISLRSTPPFISSAES
jgi:hypothetical protein